MNNFNNIQEEILKSVEVLVDSKMKNLKFNYYVEGKIVAVNSDSTYNVKINGDTEKLKARQGLTLNVNDVVLVLVPNGNTSFKFIDIKRPY
ncbi:hypothetical protein [Clostridium tertium]|uniref:hypothetical protein n=1 Tax=Clostridium tertium TaxID=1559 RepID=UPI0024B34C4D|nr:hypothetical protein [Clostridium tertium]MDI9215994.1 hypothetical protein [Clostridium tertium]